jgi:tripartite-type tricarboxylate transporter receptor subunit TctC
VPTVTEQGIPDYEIDGWSAVIGPKGLPATIVNRTNAAFHEAIALPSVHEALLKQGNMPAPGTPQLLSEFLRAEVAKYAALARRTGIRLE